MPTSTGSTTKKEQTILLSSLCSSNNMKTVYYICETSKNVNCRSAPNRSSSKVDVLPKGTAVEIIMTQNKFGYISDKGWVDGRYLIVKKNSTVKNGKIIPKDKATNETTEEKEAKKKAKELAKDYNQQYQQAVLYTNYIKNQFDSDTTKNIMCENLNGIYGLPYQFAPEIDRRVDGTDFGSVYADKIVARMPLLLMTPGKAAFMSSFSKKDRVNALVNGISSVLGESDGTALSDVISGSGRYFTFEFDYAEYYKYVNGMLWAGAKFLGIEGVQVNIGGHKGKLSSFDWSQAVNTAFQNMISSKEFVAFYVDSASSVDESFSNETTESQLSSKVNSFSDTGRELSFLLGAGAGIEMDMIEDEAKFKSTLESIENIANKYLNGNQLLKDIGNNFATVAVGGKLLFPEIWSDSSYSKSYDINIKLRTPDGDILSWYMNIYVPLCFLVAFTAPRQMSANGYKSPFLVRAFHRGLFNCDCGIVTSLSINKGKEGGWTIDHLPTVVDVSMQLKDLYQMIMITKSDEVGWFLNNTSLMDYIACSCGININQPEIFRTLHIYLMLKSNKITNMPNTIGNRILNTLSNDALKKYQTINRLLK